MMEYIIDEIAYAEEDEVLHITFEEGTKKYIMDGGWLIYNIYRVIHPNFETIFKLHKKDMYVFGNNGEYIELHYEKEDFDE